MSGGEAGPKPASTPMILPAAFVFFLSGSAALIYQVVWQRILVIFSGADVYSATVVVAVFMAGLGSGALAGGSIADRVRRTGSLMLFAVAEAGVALFGLLSAFLLYDVVYGRLGHVAASPAAAAIVLFAILLWPTFLMGMSLPLLSRGLVRVTDRAAGIVGWLYGANTLGAAIGALAATWILMPRLGLAGALDVAAGLNVLCALGAVPLAFFMREPRGKSPLEPGPAERDPGQPAPAAGFSLTTWMSLYALAGFVALSFEILWFRLLGVMLKSTSLTFGTLLAQYLFWLGLGAAAGSLVARRFHRPAAIFLWSQTAAAVIAVLAIAILVRRLPEAASLAWLHEYFSSFEPTGQPFRRYVVLSAALIGPSTFLMGLGFPFLQRAVQTDVSRLGRRVGGLLAANIAGSTAGAILTGWVLLAVFGTSGTLRVLVLLSAVFGMLAVNAIRPRRPAVHALRLAVVAIIAIPVVTLPGGVALWATLHGAPPRSVIALEDGSGVSLLKGTDGTFSGGAVVFVNGLGQSWLPYGGIHTELGALPAMIHPRPLDAAVIGLGSGDTLFAIAGRPEIERITSIEIVRPQLETLRRLLPLYRYPALEAWLGDPRIEHVFGDGRAYLRDARRRFDILEADALRPTSAYAGNLYSDEYFRLMRARLNPRGLAVTWVPTERVQRTFLTVFPHAIRFGDILIGSNDPIAIDHEAIRQRASAPAVDDYYSQAGLNIQDVLEPRLQSPVRFSMSDRDRARITDINTDLYPRDELAR